MIFKVLCKISTSIGIFQILEILDLATEKDEKVKYPVTYFEQGNHDISQV
jgi:hypothetical protein